MTMEQRMDQLEKRNKRLTVALTMTVVAMAAVVTMAATGDKDGHFDTVMANAVMAENILVMNDAGEIVVTSNANDRGNGMIYTESAKGKKLVLLGTTANGAGTVTTFRGLEMLVDLNSNDNGGFVDVLNKTGESIANMYADDYGNGVVWAGNRKGDEQTLKPGP
jgi:hypothetical protein